MGHEHVSARHESTLELTTDDWLTPAGDCIVGIEASSAPADFPSKVAAAARSPDARITLELNASSESTRITGRGDPALTFEDDRSMVLRTSTYVDERTVMVEANRAAADLERSLVSAIQEGRSIEATFSVTP